jgi:hypothetical protein
MMGSKMDHSGQARLGPLFLALLCGLAQAQLPQLVYDEGQLRTWVYDISNWNLSGKEVFTVGSPAAEPTVAVPFQANQVVSAKVLIYSDAKGGRSAEVFNLIRMAGKAASGKNGGRYTLIHNNTAMTMRLHLSRGPCSLTKPCTDQYPDNQNFFTYSFPWGYPSSGEKRSFKDGNIRGAVMVEYVQAGGTNQPKAQWLKLGPWNMQQTPSLSISLSKYGITPTSIIDMAAVIHSDPVNGAVEVDELEHLPLYLSSGPPFSASNRGRGGLLWLGYGCGGQLGSGACGTVGAVTPYTLKVFRGPDGESNYNSGSWSRDGAVFESHYNGPVPNRGWVKVTHRGYPYPSPYLIRTKAISIGEWDMTQSKAKELSLSAFNLDASRITGIRTTIRSDGTATEIQDFHFVREKGGIHSTLPQGEGAGGTTLVDGQRNSVIMATNVLVSGDYEYYSGMSPHAHLYRNVNQNRGYVKLDYLAASCEEGPKWLALRAIPSAVAAECSGTGSGSRVVMEGSGMEIYDQKDDFSFAYTKLTGSQSVVARLESRQNPHDYSKAGLMLRTSLAAGSPEISILAQNHKVEVTYRSANDGGTETPGIPNFTDPPLWMRLDYDGVGTVKAYLRTDAQTNWTGPVYSASVSLGSSFLAGLAISTYGATKLNRCVFTDLAFPAYASADVGAPGLAGKFTYANGVYTLKGAGNDIWGNADQFQYGYRTLVGDGEIVARVASVQNTNTYAKVGAMIRESSAAGSRHASILITPGDGVHFNYRDANNGPMGEVKNQGFAAPYWIKLDRKGARLTGYRSPDGSTWTEVGRRDISMPASVLMGLAGNSHNNTALATHTFDNVSFLTGAWSDANVGGPSPAGGSVESGATVTVTGGGADIWGASDQFHYRYRTLQGDGQVTVRMAGFSTSNPNGWAKAGLMIRESLDPGSRNAFIAQSAANGVNFQWRDAILSANTQSASSVSGNAPRWLRIARLGDKLTGYVSGNGSAWTQVGTATLSMGRSALVGLAVASHANGTGCGVNFDNVQ